MAHSLYPKNLLQDVMFNVISGWTTWLREVEKQSRFLKETVLIPYCKDYRLSFRAGTNTFCNAETGEVVTPDPAIKALVNQPTPDGHTLGWHIGNIETRQEWITN